MLQVGHTQKGKIPVARYHIGSKALELDKTDFKGVGRANISMEYIDKTIWVVTTVRSFFGATEDHLEHTHNSPGVTKENMAAYGGEIKNTSTASEVTKLTSSNIVGQAARSIQVHSSSLPGMILQLF